MSILVVGAGNSASLIIQQLTEINADFRVMLRDPSKAATLDLEKEQVIQGDLSDPQSLLEATKGISKLYLAMAIHADNVIWVDNVIKACQANNVDHIVKLSGFGASKQAGSHIIRMHAETDQMLIDSGLTYTLLQPNSFFQNLYASLPTITEAGQFFLPVGDASLAFIDLRDVAEVAVKTLTESGHENKTYRLTGPSSITYHGQAKVLSVASGKTIHYVPVPQAVAKDAMLASGMDDWSASVLAEILAWFAVGNYSIVTTDVEDILGKPARTFASFAEEIKELL